MKPFRMKQMPQLVTAIFAMLLFSKVVCAAESASTTTLSDLMSGPVTTASNELWNAALIEPPVGATTPVPTAEQWDNFKKHALELKTLGSLLLNTELPIAPAGKVANEGELTPDGIAALRKQQWDLWQAQVAALTDGASNSLKAIEARNFAGMVEAGDVLYNVCDSCHQLFWYPPAK